MARYHVRLSWWACLSSSSRICKHTCILFRLYNRVASNKSAHDQPASKPTSMPARSSSPLFLMFRRIWGCQKASPGFSNFRMMWDCHKTSSWLLKFRTMWGCGKSSTLLKANLNNWSSNCWEFNSYPVYQLVHDRLECDNLNSLNCFLAWFVHISSDGCGGAPEFKQWLN